jgi:sulfopyruvate decarboxylase subunit alpha
MTEETKTRATAILEAIKKAGIDLVASLPDINCLDLINALERDSDIIHVPLCREEEGIGICAGARLVGKKPAIVMQNA